MQTPEITAYVLGTASAIAVDARQHTALLLEGYGKRIVFDCGIPLIQSMHAHKCYGPVDGIFISHMHTDHCGMLANTVKQLQLLKIQKRIDVFGPAGIGRVFEQILPMLYVFETPEYAPCCFYDIESAQNFGALTVYALENRHLSKDKYIERNRENPFVLTGSYSLIADFNGIRIGYTADIDSLDSVGTFFKDCALLFCEAEHVQADLIEQFRKEQNIQRIGLVHYSKKNIPESAEIFYVSDGQQLHI